MLVELTATTRMSLGSKDAIERVQALLSNCACDYLGRILVEEADDEGERERFKLDLSKKGDLAKYIGEEISRSDKNRNRWKTSMKAIMPQPLPFERQLGSVHFESTDGSKEVHLSFDEYEMAPNVDEFQFGNRLSIKSKEVKQRGQQLAEVTLSLLKRVFDNDLFDHGFCCVSDQFDTKNLDRSDGGVRAVGLDASRCLPGFYWGNYFGEYLCELIGERVLLDVPGCRSFQRQSGVLVTNEMPPDAWSDAAFIENERRAIDHIGRHLFFEKGKAVAGKLFS